MSKKIYLNGVGFISYNLKNGNVSYYNVYKNEDEDNYISNENQTSNNESNNENQTSSISNITPGENWFRNQDFINSEIYDNKEFWIVRNHDGKYNKKFKIYSNNTGNFFTSYLSLVAGPFNSLDYAKKILNILRNWDQINVI